MTGRPEGARLAITSLPPAETAAAAPFQEGVRGLPPAIGRGWCRSLPGIFRHAGTARSARLARYGRVGRIAAARGVQRAAPAKPAPLPVRVPDAEAWHAPSETWRGPWLSRNAAKAGFGTARPVRSIRMPGRSSSRPQCPRAPDVGTAPRPRPGPGVVRSMPSGSRGGGARRASPEAPRRRPEPGEAGTAGTGPARRPLPVAVSGAAGGCIPSARA